MVNNYSPSERNKLLKLGDKMAEIDAEIRALETMGVTAMEEAAREFMVTVGELGTAMLEVRAMSHMWHGRLIDRRTYKIIAKTDYYVTWDEAYSAAVALRKWSGYDEETTLRIVVH